MYNNTETREAFPVEPWWTPPPITTQADREAAEKRHKEIITGPGPPLAIYTDGSGLHGEVEAVAVAPATNTHFLAFLGKETITNVYAAELLSILMGLNIAT